MRGRVAAVARSGVASGLRLAGLDPLVADAPEQAAAALEAAADAGDVAVLLVEEALWDAVAPELRRRLEGLPVPLVVPFPSPGVLAPEERAETYLVEMLRQAVGYRVRLR